MDASEHIYAAVMDVHGIPHEPIGFFTACQNISQLSMMHSSYNPSHFVFGSLLHRRCFATPILLLALVLVYLMPVPEARADLGWFKDSWGDVIVVTEMTDAGRARTRPSPDNPVYFKGRNLGCKLGNSIPGDKQPDIKEMADCVARILGGEGYLGAQPGGKDPELYIVLSWGYLRPGYGNNSADELLAFLGYDPNQDIAASGTMGHLIGPEVYRRGMRSQNIQTILDYATKPLYGIMITAFDYESASTPHPILYWQTRMAIPARGKYMARAMPAMMAIAAPSIGRETEKPVVRDADVRVEFGELEVLSYADPVNADDGETEKP